MALDLLRERILQAGDCVGRALVINSAPIKLSEMTLQELAELARLRKAGKFKATAIRRETSALTFTSTLTGSIQAEVKDMTVSELALELTGAVGHPVVALHQFEPASGLLR